MTICVGIPKSTSAPGPTARVSRRTLFAVLAAIFFFTAPAYAGIAPNPGGAVVITNSTTSSYVDVNTQVTQRVDNYSTTLLAFLNGSQVYSGTFLVQFSDPSVQAAVTAADSILSGDGASFGPPSLFSSSSLLQGSVTDPPVLTCSPCNQATGNTTTTDTLTFGPATILVGDNMSDTFTVLAGQLDQNINTNNEYYAYYDIVTTDTYLNTPNLRDSRHYADRHRARAGQRNNAGRRSWRLGRGETPSPDVEDNWASHEMNATVAKVPDVRDCRSRGIQTQQGPGSQ